MNKINKLLLNKNFINSVNKNFNLKNYFSTTIKFGGNTSITNLQFNNLFKNHQKQKKFTTKNKSNDESSSFFRLVNEGDSIDREDIANLEKLLNELEKQIEKNPNNSNNYLQRAYIYQSEQVNKNELATKDFEKVLELTKPGGVDEKHGQIDRRFAYYGLATQKYELNEYEDSINIIKKTFEEDNASALEYILLADCYFSIGDYSTSQYFYDLSYKQLDNPDNDLGKNLDAFFFLQKQIECCINLFEENQNVSIKKIILDNQDSKIIIEKLKNQSDTIEQLYQNSKSFVDSLNSIILLNIVNKKFSHDEKIKIGHLKLLYTTISDGSKRISDLKKRNPNITDPSLKEDLNEYEETLLSVNQSILQSYF